MWELNAHQIGMGQRTRPLTHCQIKIVLRLSAHLVGSPCVRHDRLWTQTKNADTPRDLPALVNGILDSCLKGYPCRRKPEPLLLPALYVASKAASQSGLDSLSKAFHCKRVKSVVFFGCLAHKAALLEIPVKGAAQLAGPHGRSESFSGSIY
jgi:hypothetical protein